ncbi:putative ATP-dependent RNA helicase DHX35-like protein [Gorgonomyces haynaldii]|nr:putative ATP-dependent RNA helicase DHX35-like protein [Gorgonomyces haynaldii]
MGEKRWMSIINIVSSLFSVGGTRLLMFWKPGTVQPGSLIDRDTSDGFYLSFNQNPHLKIEEQQRQLPIYKNKRELLYLVEKYPVTLVMGPSGSGKTTQVPQYLLESHQRIICTQPRRVQCTAVARRVSEETKTKLGELVGYSVRFDSNRSKDSRIVFVTDEQLFQEMLLDPLLSQYDVIMIDEAHERSIYTDILLGLLKKYYV